MTSDLIRRSRLENGIEIVTESIPWCCGVYVGASIGSGSRHEAEHQAGVSHLLEHMVFKGTERYSGPELADTLDDLAPGSDAWTSKTETFYTAHALPENLPLVLDLMSEILLRPRLDAGDLEMERAVVLDELRADEDRPEEQLGDLFCQAVWPDHPMGRPVIGTAETIESLSRDDLEKYRAARYGPPLMIFSAAGCVDHQAYETLVRERFGHLEAGPPLAIEEPPSSRPSTTIFERDTEQVHILMGMQVPSVRDERHYPLSLLNYALGGGMSSRLFQEIRERRGLCYSIGSDLGLYPDVGLLSVGASAAPDAAAEVIELSLREIRRMAESGLEENELHRVKGRVRAALLLAHDSSVLRFGRLTAHLRQHERIISVEELSTRVDRLTRDDCAAVAQELLSAPVSLAVLGPVEAGAFNGVTGLVN